MGRAPVPDRVLVVFGGTGCDPRPPGGRAPAWEVPRLLELKKLRSSPAGWGGRSSPALRHWTATRGCDHRPPGGRAPARPGRRRVRVEVRLRSSPAGRRAPAGRRRGAVSRWGLRSSPAAKGERQPAASANTRAIRRCDPRPPRTASASRVGGRCTRHGEDVAILARRERRAPLAGSACRSSTAIRLRSSPAANGERHPGTRVEGCDPRPPGRASATRTTRTGSGSLVRSCDPRPPRRASASRSANPYLSGRGCCDPRPPRTASAGSTRRPDGRGRGRDPRPPRTASASCVSVTRSTPARSCDPRPPRRASASGQPGRRRGEPVAILARRGGRAPAGHGVTGVDTQRVAILARREGGRQPVTATGSVDPGTVAILARRRAGASSDRGESSRAANGVAILARRGAGARQPERRRPSRALKVAILARRGGRAPAARPRHPAGLEPSDPRPPGGAGASRGPPSTTCSIFIPRSPTSGMPGRDAWISRCSPG